MTDDLEMLIPRNDSGSLNVEMMTNVPDMMMMMLIFNTTESYTSVHIKIHPANESIAVDAFLRFGFPPTPDQYDVKVRLPQSAGSLPQKLFNETYNTTADPYVWFVDEHVLSAVGSYYVGVWPSGVDEGSVSIINSTTAGSNEDFDVHIYTARCLYWSELFEQWFPSGCKVGGMTTSAYTHCQCNHLTAFGGNFYIPANDLISFDYVMTEAALEDSPILAAIVGGILALYVMFAVAAIRVDIKHQKQIRPDVKVKKGEKDSSYIYLITVFTGIHHRAGTTSKVCVQLLGNQYSSKPISLTSESRQEFQDGSIDTFLTDTFTSLGVLQFVRVWHNCSGFTPEWFLSRLMVEDVQTGRSWYFLCNEWHREKDSPKTYRALMFEEAVLNRHLFVFTSFSDLCKRHLTMLAFVTRSVRSKLTCLESLTCLFAFVFFSMLVTSVFLYGAQEDPSEQQTLQEFQFSVDAIINGVLCAVIALPIHWLLAFLFGCSEPITFWKNKVFFKSSKLTKSGVKKQQSLQEVKVEGMYTEQPEKLTESGDVVPAINISEAIDDTVSSTRKHNKKDGDKFTSYSDWETISSDVQSSDAEGEVELKTESYVRGDSLYAEPEEVTLKIPTLEQPGAHKTRDQRRQRRFSLQTPVSGDERLAQKYLGRQAMKKSRSLSGPRHDHETQKTKNTLQYQRFMILTLLQVQEANISTTVEMVTNHHQDIDMADQGQHIDPIADTGQLQATGIGDSNPLTDLTVVMAHPVVTDGGSTAVMKRQAIAIATGEVEEICIVGAVTATIVVIAVGMATDVRLPHHITTGLKCQQQKRHHHLHQDIIPDAAAATTKTIKHTDAGLQVDIVQIMTIISITRATIITAAQEVLRKEMMKMVNTAEHTIVIIIIIDITDMGTIHLAIAVITATTVDTGIMGDTDTISAKMSKVLIKQKQETGLKVKQALRS
ncbi:uncharacterized protein [Ptychodera flava]|uniref:uncharacterized protein n=1 Tax=Ptychodera flava TaxID=63121 RepID=UPI00396A248A